jgi:hypothetical protein
MMMSYRVLVWQALTRGTGAEGERGSTLKTLFYFAL